jgi:hypothetical protein
MADRGHNKYKTKEGVFKAVTPILLEQFQLMLVHNATKGPFLRMSAIWQMDLWLNIFWMAQMHIPQIWILPQDCHLRKH